MVELLNLQPIQSVLQWSGSLPNYRALFAWCFASHLHASHTVSGVGGPKPLASLLCSPPPSPPFSALMIKPPPLGVRCEN